MNRGCVTLNFEYDADASQAAWHAMRSRGNQPLPTLFEISTPGRYQA